MSRLAKMAQNMKTEGAEAIHDKHRNEVMQFEVFYQTSFYKKLKGKIEEQLNKLDRQQVVDPGQLVLIQGQRNALIGILDDLNKQERLVNNLKRK